MRVRNNLFFSFIAVLLIWGCAKNTKDFPADYSKTYGTSPNKPKLTVSVSPAVNHIAGEIAVNIKHNLAESYIVEPYHIDKDNVKGFNVFPQGATDTIENGNLHRRYTFLLEPLDTGEFELNLPALVFTQFSVGGEISSEIETIQPEPVTIRIPPKTNESTPAPEIYNLLKPKFKYVYGLYALISASLAAILCFYLLQFIRKKKPAPSKKLSAFEYVMQQFQELEDQVQQNCINSHDVYLQLNLIFKYYLENHLKIILPGQTLEEGLPAIDSNEYLTTENQHMIREFCNISDLVKFAGYEPESSISLNALKQIKQLISPNQTKPL